MIEISQVRIDDAVKIIFGGWNNTMIFGNALTIDIELRQADGGHYTPPGDVEVNIFLLDSTTFIPGVSPVLGVTATQVMIENDIWPGNFRAFLDTSKLAVGSYLVRVAVPYITPLAGICEVIQQQRLDLIDPSAAQN